MRVSQLIDSLKGSRPANFIWGAGCSGLYRPVTTCPADRKIWDAVKKYDGDPLMSEIKRNFWRRTLGIEDVHSCLLALNGDERKEVLKWKTNWANVCMAELLRLEHAGRVLTPNFDGSLVAATATLDLMLPLYRRDYPELRDAATPCIYLVGEAPAATVSGLIERGADTGPWIVIGCSGKPVGLIRALLAIPEFEQGLYWIGHFDAAPPEELRDRFFTQERNAHRIEGFDADSFMAYLLRGLEEFPPPAVQTSVEGNSRADASTAIQRGKWLKTFESQRPAEMDFRVVKAEIDRVKRADSAQVKAVIEKLSHDFEKAVRAGRSAGGLGHAALGLADHRTPRESRPLLLKAVDLMEEEAPGDVLGNFAQVCSRLAQFSTLERAREWYARADACFVQMDFGPEGGATQPYNFPKWAQMLAEWASIEDDERSDAIFDRARQKLIEVVAKWTELTRQPPDRPEIANSLLMMNFNRRVRAIQMGRTAVAAQFVKAVHERARRIAPERALALLSEARPWIEELRSDEAAHASMLAEHLFREAEAAPERQTDLVQQAEQQFQLLLRILPSDHSDVYCNWASGLGELGRYDEADRKFREAEQIKSDWAPLYKNWSSILIHAARERGSGELWERARQHAQQADDMETGQGGYNLACIASETRSREDIARWLSHSAEYGKIPSLSHILRDVSFEPVREDPWFRTLIDEIFDAGC